MRLDTVTRPVERRFKGSTSHVSCLRTPIKTTYNYLRKLAQESTFSTLNYIVAMRLKYC